MSPTPSKRGRTTIAILVLAMIGGLLAAPVSAQEQPAAQGPKPVELQILALNDFHGNINTTSSSFGGTGGAQNLATNIAAAESRIRDADIAAEASNLTKAQVLQQSSMAALAQANSAPQSVLSLLR